MSEPNFSACRDCANTNCTQSEDELANCEKLKQPTDKREVIALTKKNYYTKGYSTGSEFSEPTGFFHYAHATLTYQDEDPAVYCSGADAVPLNQVKIASPEQKQRYLEIHDAMEKLRADLKACEQEIAANGLPVSWEWILQHGKPRDDGYVPVPHHSRTALANLRKGSKVVIGVVSSQWAGITGKVGKIVKKRSKYAIVRFGERQFQIPYSELKPAHEISKSKRAEMARGSEASAEVVKKLNKFVREHEI